MLYQLYFCIIHLIEFFRPIVPPPLADIIQVYQIAIAVAVHPDLREWLSGQAVSQSVSEVSHL